MAFIFKMRSTSVHGSRRTSFNRRDGSSPNPLPAIDEDHASFDTSHTAPPIPPRARTRPYSQRHLALGIVLGYPPSTDSEEGPPEYDSRGEKLAELRKDLKNNKHIAKRGGWRTLMALAVVLFLIIVGLVVGLVLGLRQKENASSNNSDSSSSNTTPLGGASGDVQPPLETPNSPFPLGSYTFNTYLSTVATNCTSNPSTWQCYPFNTYSQSRTNSLATFDWIISSPTPQTYTISSTPNVFSILFTNTTLTLRNANQADEHYFFQLSMRKPTKPSTQLGTKNVAATCYFGETTMQGLLYTKMKKTFPATEAEKGGYQSWPFAVKIEQVASAGKDVPECVDLEGASLGDFSVSDGSQLCDCLYLNTGT